ncbi:hypothetical protein MP638_002271 [Amoeboaphelidium occidentale]|nr:hypothetical protein MP638_002271 [Amoeboaphelidium occidentale]
MMVQTSPNEENSTPSLRNRRSASSISRKKSCFVDPDDQGEELLLSPLARKTSPNGGYSLKFCYRLHFREDANTDADMVAPDVSDSAFMPLCDDNEGKYVVATCGSNSVCFTDCETGKVFMKYLHLDEVHEIFTCLAWTVVRNKEDDPVRLLAVAGEAKTVKLINYEIGTCFKYLQGHTRPVVCLKFCTDNPNILLSGSEDGTVKRWDIGDAYLNEGAKCLNEFKLSNYMFPLSVAVDFSGAKIIIGDSDCSLDIRNLNGRKQRVYLDGDGWPESPFDDVHFIEDDVVLLKTTGDDGVILCNLSTSTKQSPDVIKRLEWKGDLAYTMKGTVSKDESGAAFYAVGDLDGNVLVYDLGNLSKQRYAKSTSQKYVWKLSTLESTERIKSVAVSHDMKYIVATDQADCVWIYSK